MRRLLAQKGRWPRLMRIYGLMPWRTGDLTDEEWVSLLAEDDAAIRAEKAEIRQRGRQVRSARRR